MPLAVERAGRLTWSWPNSGPAAGKVDLGDEAHRCLSIGAYRGAIALTRAVVEATAKHHEITRGMLDMKIDEMANLAEEPITREEAEDVLELMDAIMTRVYQEPAQVKRVRARREERRGK